MTRLYAYKGVETEQIARILDDAEYLVALMMRPDDGADNFRRHLGGMARKYPEFIGIAEEYDQAMSRK